MRRSATSQSSKNWWKIFGILQSLVIAFALKVLLGNLRSRVQRHSGPFNFLESRTEDGETTKIFLFFSKKMRP